MSDKKKTFPARVHILIASKSKKAIVIRRGPSNHVCILGWDRSKDTFSVSQWLKGTLYERRSDISADGKYWIYFAGTHRYKSETKGTWTAIAKVPWLKAITLYGKGDSWYGGGLMGESSKYWLNDHECSGHFLMHESKEVFRMKDYPLYDTYGGEYLNIYYNRLQRDGWSYFKYDEDKSVTIFEKKLCKNWVLKKYAYHGGQKKEGQGVYWDTHELQDVNGKIYLFEDWEWAEYLDDKYVFYIKKGCLYKLEVCNSPLIEEAELVHNFNDYKFEALKAPY